MGAPAYAPEVREEAVNLAAQIGPAAAAQKLNLNPGTVRNWMSRAGRSTDVELLQATAVARASAAMAHAQEFEDFLQEVQLNSATYVNTVAIVNREYAMKVATLPAGQIVERVNHETGARWVTFLDEEAEGLRLKVLALKEASLEVPHAIGAFTRATHDLRLLREQSTENVATSVSFDSSLQPAAIEADEEILEADEVD